MDAPGPDRNAAAPIITPAVSAPSPGAKRDLPQRLAELHTLSLGEVRSEWRRLFRAQPPNLSRDLLLRAIAHRMQELAYGGLPRATLRRLSTLADEFRAAGQISLNSGPQLKPGARLVREWHGRTHTVTITENGFEYAGRTFPSLTKIARETPELTSRKLMADTRLPLDWAEQRARLGFA